MSPTRQEDPLGIDRDKVDGWLIENVASMVGPLRYRLIAGGRSNLTYEVSDALGTRWALRRPPVGNVLPSAHDMAREHRIIAALQGSAVPVPEAVALCTDPDVTDGVFHVMSFVEGSIIKSEWDVEHGFAEPLRAAVGASLVESLADLHRITPADVGLDDLGQPEDYVGRQLRRWYRQFQHSRCREVPAIDQARATLEANIPVQQRTSIVHGDFRIDNCVFGADGRVRAVLDWELCTLGDPLADLGLLMVYWIEPGESARFMPNGTPTAVAGFPARRALAEHYAAASGLDISDLGFYTALGYWKLACILEGIYARYSSGTMPEEDDFPAELCGEQVLVLADAALQLTEQLV
jgi:aminoglycoside phosphotransferase (APT) family kinase protein